MQTTTVALTVVIATTLLLSQVSQTYSAALRDRIDVGLSDPDLTVAVLEELIDFVSKGNNLHKRGLDMGYNNRYRVASSVGSKLMALKQAADWNGPGRKRREVAAAVDEQ